LPAKGKSLPFDQYRHCLGGRTGVRQTDTYDAAERQATEANRLLNASVDRRESVACDGGIRICVRPIRWLAGHFGRLAKPESEGALGGRIQHWPAGHSGLPLGCGLELNTEDSGTFRPMSKTAIWKFRDGETGGNLWQGEPTVSQHMRRLGSLIGVGLRTEGGPFVLQINNNAQRRWDLLQIRY
jgi:hypothetical protein